MNLASGNFRAKTRLQNAVRVQYVSSSCGVCGKASIDKVFQMTEPLPNLMTLDDVFISSVPAKLRSRQTNFEMTGGVHGAAIFTPDGQIKVAQRCWSSQCYRKVGGRCREWGFPSTVTAVVSSRAGFEITDDRGSNWRCCIAFNAASSMAHDLANRSRLALYSLSAGRFNDHSSL